MSMPLGFSPAGLLVSPVATLLLTWLVRFQTPTSWDARSCADATAGDASSNASAAAATSLDVMGSLLCWGQLLASDATQLYLPKVEQPWKSLATLFTPPITNGRSGSSVKARAM